jgi:hypothetical protein
VNILSSPENDPKNRAGSGGREEREIIPALLNAPKKKYLPPFIKPL